MTVIYSTDYCSRVEDQTYEGYIDVIDEVESAQPKDKYRSELDICWRHVTSERKRIRLFLA